MTSPAIAHSRQELLAVLDAGRGRIGLVPTMGALHSGHGSLMKLIAPQVERVVVSIFVNPLQFGPNEDLHRYPRTLAQDLEFCAHEGVDVVFAPTVDEVYQAQPPEVTVAPGPLGDLWEGAARPGHFAGVLTVVAKLIGLVRPHQAVFGEKDYQQLTLLRAMAAELCLGVEILAAPTVREPDGLALSSRNRYLDQSDRVRATALYRALRAAQAAAVGGPDRALVAAREVLDGADGIDLDYLALADSRLRPLAHSVSAGSIGRMLVAATVGSTRLLDNVGITFGRPDDR
jgi:pantoate--beta-alanine ligase